MHNAEFKSSRRRFLQAGSLVVGSLLIPIADVVFANPLVTNSLPDGTVKNGNQEINDWVWIAEDNSVVIGVSQCEVGQGIFTGMAAVIASEMDVDWNSVSVRFVTGRDAYRQVGGGVGFSQFVAASTSMTNFYERIRIAGAQVRDLFLRSGAIYFDQNIDKLKTDRGFVINTLNGEKIAYGKLLTIASQLTLNPEPLLKTDAEERAVGIIGENIKRLDTPSKIDGTAEFGIDIDLPDMLVGTLWVVPGFGGEVKSIKNRSAVLQLPGIIDLIETHHWSTLNMMGLDKEVTKPNAILIIADTYWHAKKGLEALEVDYIVPEDKRISNESIYNDSFNLLQQPDLSLAANNGDARAIINESIDTSHYHSAYYKAPYIAHATMEPVNATSFYHDDHIETWGPFQGQDLVRFMLARIYGFTPEQIIVNTTFLGGSFGRKYLPDAVMHATTASKIHGKPVKIIYSRAVDIRHEYYRPGIIGHYQATLNSEGFPKALWVRTTGQSLFWQMKRAKMEKMGFDETMVECVYNTIYKIPNLYVETAHVEQPIPLSYLRGVGTTSSIFFYESFISELARKSDKDDYEYRAHLLKDHPEALKVLEKTAEAAEWDKPLETGKARGMSYNVWVGRDELFTTYVALVAEVQVKDQKIKIDRIICGIDCGKVINPNLISANLEGGIGYALTGALKSKLTFKEGAIVEGNFDTYPLLNLSEMPEIKIVFIESDRKPQGTGEVAAGVVAPAIASALARLTGQIFREMPFTLS